VQLKIWLSPPVVDALLQQMTVGDEPSCAVTAKVMFNTVPFEAVRSKEPDHSPAEIVSGDTAESEKKQGLEPLDNARVSPRTPCVVLRPFTTGQSLGEIEGPIDLK